MEYLWDHTYYCIHIFRMYISLLSDSECGSEHDSDDNGVQQAIEASLQDIRFFLLSLSRIVALHSILISGLVTKMTRELPPLMSRAYSQAISPTCLSPQIWMRQIVWWFAASTFGETLCVPYHDPISIVKNRCTSYLLARKRQMLEVRNVNYFTWVLKQWQMMARSFMGLSINDHLFTTRKL